MIFTYIFYKNNSLYTPNLHRVDYALGAILRKFKIFNVIIYK